jgi:predicted nucleotidyltransferase
MPMDLSESYAAICPSLEGPVLDVLAHTTRPLTGREISRLAKRGSERGVRLVLNRLSEHGVVDRQEAGSASLYVLNRDHVAAPVVLELVRLRKALLDRIRQEIASWHLQPLHASMFGSAARCDGAVHSDVDLLIVRPDGLEVELAQWEEQVDVLAHHVRRWSGNHAAIAELSLKQLRAAVRRQEPIIDELRKTSISLAGSEFSDLIQPSRAKALT